MRVLFLNYEYPPLGGGAGNATHYILREFAKYENLEVDLVTSSIDEQYHLEKIGKNIRIHKLPIGKNKRNLHYQSQRDLLAYAWKAFWYCQRMFEKNHFELIHAFFTVPCGFLAFMFNVIYKTPYIVSLRGADVPGYSERFAVQYKVLKPLVRMIWKKSRSVIANSLGLKKLSLETSPQQAIGIVPNGVDTDHFKPVIKEKDTDKFIITPGASRITARKGIGYLIEAVGKLLPKYPNITVKILGEGSDRLNLERLVTNLGIKNNIHFLGRINREETVKYYQEADLFVLPSLNEGMSNAMLEALACGLPLIATRTGGSFELIKEGVNGLIVQMRDATGLAEQIEKIILNNDLRNKMARESRNLAKNFSWRSVAEKYHDEYVNVTKK